MKALWGFIKKYYPGILLLCLAVAIGTYTLLTGNSYGRTVKSYTLEKNAASEPVGAAVLKQEETDSEYTYYYTPSGKKWHLDRDCRYIKNSVTVHEGTYGEVTALGLEPCSSCGKPED